MDLENQTVARSEIPSIRFSLIIATLDDAGDLLLCLESLATQVDAPRFEVIVVDQNDDDQLVPLIERFSERLEIRHERVDFRGASRARNVGARLAQGTWLGFPDDDCQLLPDALQQADRASQNPRLRVITGQTIDEAGAPNVLRWKQAPTYFNRWSMFGCLSEATLFVHREVFLQAEGFDQRFGPGAQYPAAEGAELMDRLFGIIVAGQALYTPAIKMRHPTKIPPFTRWAVGRFYAYATGDGAMIAKTPQLHVLNWGARTVLSAIRSLFTRNPWQAAAYAARLAGMVKGFVAFNLARLTCKG